MIVVTAPTGKIGHYVVRDLLDAGEDVRVVVRGAGKLPDGVRDRAEVIEGSHGDPDVIDRALAEAEALFWLCPPDTSKTLDQAYVDFTRPAAEAIRRQGVGRVVSVTALGRGTRWQNEAGIVTASIHMDDLLMTSGAAFRGLAMPSFMDNALQQKDAIKQGKLFGPFNPDKKLPHTATRDMGARAAELLRDRTWKGQEEAPLLGPEDLSFTDIAAILTEVLGHEVRYTQTPFDGFKAQLLGRGMTESFAQGYVDMMRAKNEGMDNEAARVPGGDGPTTFRQWAEEELRPAMAS